MPHKQRESLTSRESAAQADSWRPHKLCECHKSSDIAAQAAWMLYKLREFRVSCVMRVTHKQRECLTRSVNVTLAAIMPGKLPEFCTHCVNVNTSCASAAQAGPWKPHKLCKCHTSCVNAAQAVWMLHKQLECRTSCVNAAQAARNHTSWRVTSRNADRGFKNLSLNSWKIERFGLTKRLHEGGRGERWIGA